MARIVAVLDIGKTNAKLVVHDLKFGRDLHTETRPNQVVAAPPYPHFDTKVLFAFLLAALGRAAERFPIDAISVTTHGACFALLDGDGALALPILDYEHDGPEEVHAEYDAVRPPFAQTFSPRLPNGLNAGAQLFWLRHRFPDAFARVRHIVPYPQYWVHRLTGVLACEATSLGCHTDLWQPEGGDFSSLVERMGWRPLFAPLRPAFAVAGPLLAEIAAGTPLAGRSVPVHVGLHDSNASLLPHLVAGEAQLSVVSTGTWVVAFALGGALGHLDPARDMLANVDAFGRPVPSARFMGGREFDRLTGGLAVAPTHAEIERVLADGIMAFPSFAGRTGPFPDAEGRWSHDPATLSAGERTAVASLYVAMMTSTLLDTMGAGGPTIVSGPFAADPLLLDALFVLTGRAVRPSQGASGTSAGAAGLASASSRRDAAATPAGPPEDKRRDLPIERYAALWHSARPVKSGEIGIRASSARKG